MKKSDIKVMRAIKASEKFLAGVKENSHEYSSFTIVDCEKRNLEVFREMIGQDKRKLIGWKRELYQAI